MTLILLLSLAARAEVDPDEIPTEAPDLTQPTSALPVLERTEPAVVLGLGVAVPAADLAAAPLLRLEGSATPPVVGGRLRPFASVAWTAPRREGTVTDDRLPPEDGSASWTLVLSQVHLAAGVALRALPHGAPISPELSLAPMVMVVQSELRGTTDGLDLGGVSTWQVRPGFMVGVDLVVDAGPGRLRLGLATTSGHVDTLPAGRISALAITPTVGFQLPFSTREVP